MPLTPGTRLGPHEIIESLGAGGMGEVYRARDTRLDRMVAVKVLPGHLSDNEELRQRFDREARAISQLSHPHVCALYDVGHQDGVDYLVMEYLEGETLADRLLKGRLSVEQVLRYGIQIADALDKAHRLGIVHRDLKPGNVMVTRSGVKLLDFGLAKLRATTPGNVSSGFSVLSTQTDASLTAQGTILGTFEYMAPEQLEGRDADARSDIFALGALLYEMATGQKPFQGKSQASLIAAILESGRFEIYVKPFPEPGRKWEVSTGGGLEPRWRRDGKELFYVTPDGKVMAVEVGTDAAFEAGTPQALFVTSLKNASGWRYDVSPDGQRFLVNRPIDQESSPPITLVQNWTALLKR